MGSGFRGSKVEGSGARSKLRGEWTMKTRSLRFRIATMMASGMAVVTLSQATTAHAVASKAESSCAASLGKGVSKLAKTLAKELSKCRLDDISGKAPGACPNAANTSKIDSSAAAVTSAAQTSCKSVCSVSSSVECIADSLCPPRVTVSSGAAEQCSAAGTAYFDMHNIGFPGAHCEAALGHQLTKPADIGDCAADVAETAGNDLIDAIFGSVNNASSISAEAQGCLSAISKGALKLSNTVVKGVSKCHNTLLDGASGNPAACQTSDPKLVAKIDKMEAKLDGLIDSKCTLATILELDLCGNGVGLTMSIADAKACIKAAAIEVSDSTVPPVLREQGHASIIDAAYPPAARCGDNIVNQLPNSQALMGEECDGSDDAACLGACLPPGDSFECTCGNKARMRLFASHELTDADAGWTGVSHQQGVADLSGYITQLQNCNCTAFSGPTCTGTSSDPVCDLTGFQAPSCSWEPFSATRCDARGNSNGTDENRDCAICDQWSANAGAFCADERGCDAQCYNSAGAVTSPCENQSDCGAGEVCRGQCDKGQTCLIIPNGAPLPVSAAGADVCAVQRFRTDVTGTRNVITGEHEVNYRLYSVIHLGERTTRPCPVCGGFCVGGANDREICEGRCSTTSATSCRFDVDCPSGETCPRTTPDCPGSSAFCQLDLVCGAEVTTPSDGLPCHIEYEHPVFGTMSNDCLPSASANITGQGFQIDYLASPTSTPATTGMVSFPSTYPCVASGLELYECPCPAQKAPNGCSPACNAADRTSVLVAPQAIPREQAPRVPPAVRMPGRPATKIRIVRAARAR